MPLQGLVDADHMPINKFSLIVPGFDEVLFTKVSGLERELGVIDLPDRTRATGGQKGASELTVEVPMHHSTDVGLMDGWFDDGQDPVDPDYKKNGTLTHTSNTTEVEQVYTLLGCWVSKFKLPDLDMADDGAMAVVEYTLQVDEVVPVSA